jgi:LysM repeat protein
MLPEGGVVMLSACRNLVVVAFMVVLAIATSSCERPLHPDEAGISKEIPSVEISSAAGLVENSQDSTDSDSGDEGETSSTESADEGTLDAMDSESSSEDESGSQQAAQDNTLLDSSTTPDANVQGATSQEDAVDQVNNQGSEPASGQSSSTDAQGTPAADQSGAQVVSETSASQLISHIVAPGETLYSIGLQYSRSWLDIAKANVLIYPDYIYAGQILVIPSDEPVTVELETVSDAVTRTVEMTYHTVNLGETLESIASAYNVTWTEIAEANGISTPDQIYPGQILKIPGYMPGFSPELSHVVYFGETLFSISLIYGVPMSAIAEANGLAPPYMIYAGQTILIPRG